MKNLAIQIKQALVLLILIIASGNKVYLQNLIHSESFETDGEGTRYTSNTYSYCPTDPDYFFRTNTNPVLPAGCSAGFGNALTNLQGSYFWAGEDIKSNVSPVCSRAPGQITTQNIVIAGYTSLQVSLFLATASNNNARWETADSINIQASIDGGPYRTVGRFMGNNISGGNLIIDDNLNGVIDPAETTICDILNFTKYTFNIPGTGSNINIRIDFDQCGGTEESAIDLIELKGTASPCSINLTSGVGTNVQNVNIGSPITTITYATTGASGATFTGLPPGITGSWASNVVTISGSPTTLVGSPFNYTVNLVGCVGSATGSFTVSCPTITVSNPSSTAATQLLPFSRSFNASGGTAPYTYSTSSALPAGLTLSNAGLLHGTPAVSGTFPIVVSATDANGCSGIGSTYNLLISAGTIGVARWVNPSGGTPPAQVVVNCNTYNTAGGAYTTIQSAINAAGNGDVVYITDGTYANASVVANCITGGVSAQNYLLVSGKTNLIITSATGSYCNSAAVLTGYGFRIATGNNITIQGLELQNVPVNAFYNSNAGTQTSNVTIKNNYVLGTYGHGIKTDDHPSDGAIDRSIWEITGNRFENIGSYNPGSCTLGPVSAIWLAQAGYHFNIFDNTIINTRWAGILCVGQGGNNNWDFASVGTVVSPGLLTVSGNRIDQTVNAGIQIGFSAGAFYYSNGANITHNKITNANSGNFAGIGGITMLQTNILGVSITYNDVSASNNALAIDITGWQGSFDTRTITNNNFYSLTGGHGVTHIAGIAPNTLDGQADNLNNYNFRNNYWGAASGPTYSTNPGGTGVGLLKETTLRGTSPTPAGIVYSLNDFVYTPFRTTPVTVNSVVACSMLSLSTTKVDVLCNGNSTGTIDLMVTGGSIPYTYNWNTGQTSQDRSGLAAGTYTVTVTDASCSTSSVSVTITQPTAIVLTETHVNVVCNGASTGSIDLTVSGGAGGYTYSWTGGVTTQDRSGLSAGTYTVTVTDANSCTKTTSATVTQPTAIVLTETHVNVVCNGASTGSIDLTVSGGAGGYTYSWTGGVTTQDRFSLAAGTYTVTVTDANSCTKTTSATVTQPTAIVLTETHVNVVCNGASTGSIDLTVSGGAGGYTYSWTGGVTTQDRFGLAAGTYTVTVMDANSCTKTTSATISEPALLTVSTTPTNVICNSDGTITLTISGGISPYDITWDGPGANDGTANNQASGYMISSLPAGTYAITVTDENGCIKTASATITEPGVVAVTATPTHVLCNGGSGKVTLTITGGTAPYDITWDGPAANDGTAINQASGYMISSLPAGTYAITVTDENGCIKTASATITEPSVLAATATPTNVLCNGGSGKVTLTITGGTSPYDITWDGPAANDGTAINQASGYMISSLPAGTYAITVTDENGCIKTASATITEPVVLAATATPTNVLCNGGSGKVTLTITGGTSPYDITWDGPAANDGTAINQASGYMISSLPAGTYAITVTDENGCIKTASATITEPVVLAATATPTNVLCNGGSGKVTLTITGGTAPYDITWDGPAANDGTAINQASGYMISSLPAGTYAITVTDENGCIKTASATISEPAVLAATATPTPVLCNGGSGKVTLTITGGTSPYDITWDGPAANDGTAINQASGYMISSLPAGTYAISVTDENGCIKTASATITEPAVLAATATPTNVLCNGGSGKVTLTITGGTSPYDITWDGPAANDGTAINQASGYMISSLPAGTYAISVTDENGCIKTASATITEPAVLAATATPTNVLCNGGSGKVTLTITGGTSPYDITWDGPAANDGTAINQASGYMISSLPAGTYAITVTDENGCIKTASATITEPVVLAATATPTHVLCNGGSGKVTLTITGGTSPYDITWDGPAANDGTAINQASGYMISSLPAGTYAISVTDENGCIKTASATITEPAVLAATATPTHVLCNGGSGKVTLTITGGTSPYDITWDGPAANDGTAINQASGYMISSLPAGTYAITVTDENGCIKTASATITEPVVLAATATPTNVLCNGGSGKVTLTITGGTSPYDITWDGPAANDGTAINQASGYMISSLPAGTYAISVTDENGCIKTASATISEPAVLAATATPTHVLCNGGSGKVTLTITGGTSPYDITWDGPAANDGTAINQASGYMISSLPAGTYAISVTDENGCIKTASATITEPAVLAATATPTHVLCNGGSGKVTLTITGGTSPYDITWDGPAANDGTAINQASGYMISSLPAGTYAITVTDENGCIKTASATITEPVVLAATATPTNVLCNGGSGKVTLTITGGTSPYDITWDGPAANDGTAINQASGYMISSLPAGTYAISVTDENGCIKTASATISEPAVLAATATPTPVLCNGGSGKVTLTITGGTSPYDITWDGPAANDGTAINQASGYMISSLPAGTYAITVTDENGCIKTASATITEPAVLAATATPTNVLCNGGSGKVTLTITGGTSPYDITWDGPGANDGTANNQASGYMISSLPAGTYAITVTDENGCIKTASATINEPAAMVLSTTTTPSCTGGATGIIDLTVLGGTMSYNYLWSNGAVSQDISGLAGGTYTVTVTDANGCSKTTSAIVSQSTAMLLTTTTVATCVGGNIGSIDLTVSGGTPTYSYLWSNTSTAQDINGLGVGTYTVIVTDMNNCTATTSASITTLPLPCGWTAEPNGVGCNAGNNFTYNFSSKVFTATSTNCYYPNSFTSDVMAFAQYDLCGNGSITAQVTSITGGLGWAGVTMRESNAAGAKKAQLMTNLSNFSRREFRTTTGGQAYPQQFPSQNRYWLRITRTGNQFSMYTSPNGIAWYFIAAQNITMSSCIEMGLVVTNYNPNSTVTATFANVSVTGGSIMRPTINTQEDIITAADFTIMPNPTTGIISLDLSSYGKRQVQLDMYNLQGKLLQSTNMETGRGKEEIDLTAFANGMYLIRVRAEGVPDMTKRVVVNSNY